MSLAALIENFDTVVEAALDAASADAVAKAASGTKGELASSISYRRLGQFGREIFSSKPYAEFVENGRPGFTAKSGMLRFVVNGATLFRKSVGPAAAKPFLAPARNVFEASASQRVEEALGRLA